MSRSNDQSHEPAQAEQTPDTRQERTALNPDQADAREAALRQARQDPLQQ